MGFLLQQSAARLPSVEQLFLFSGLPRIRQPRVWTERVTVARQTSHCNCWQTVSANWQSSDREGKANAPKASGAKEQLKVLMAAGGTGGHVYPAIAIADELRRLNGDAVEVEFVGSKDRMEWWVVPRAGYKIRSIPAVAICRPFTSFQNWLVPAKLLLAVFSSWNLLRQVKPNVVVGTGGYVSGPLCLVAAMMGYPVAIQEQNAYAGLTNRLLGKVAKAVFIAFLAAVPYFPKDSCCVLYGNPTRTELGKYMSPVVARCFFFPPHDQARMERAQSKDTDGQINEFGESMRTDSMITRKQVVLILGGSLGAQAVNRVVAGMATTMLEGNPTRHIVWQTGPKYYEGIIHQVGSHPRLAILPYINAMDLAYAAADLVVARAGAITCSELLVTGKPSILIPSPNVAEDHQTKNAMAMEEQGCAKAIVESSLDSSLLEASINELLGDSNMLMKMTERALKAATPNASNEIAEHVLKLAKDHFSVGLN